MKTLILYDSAYGNTEKVAKAIGTAIIGDVKVLRVSEVNSSELKSVNLLIVGSPTLGFRPSKSVQAFLAGLPEDSVEGISVAAFDTRMPAAEVGKGLRFIMKVGGYAAPVIARELKNKGGTLVAPPEGFFVKGKEGPLSDGEIERAAKWIKSIMASI